jgi:hypothetical protein
MGRNLHEQDELNLTGETLCFPRFTSKRLALVDVPAQCSAAPPKVQSQFSRKARAIPATRHVLQSKLSGRWEVRRPGDKRSAYVYSSSEAARRRAVRFVKDEGGGHVYILNAAGKVTRTISVR